MFKRPIYESYIDSWWLSDILDGFSKAVDDKDSVYYKERIAYEQWREFKRMVNKKGSITLRSDLRDWIEFIDPDNDEILWVLHQGEEFDNTGPFMDYLIDWIGYNELSAIAWKKVKDEEPDQLQKNPLAGTLKYSASVSSTCAPNYAYSKEQNNENINKEENKTMFNFDFGPVNDKVCRISAYGLAIKNKAGTYVSYNTKEDAIVDVDVFNFGGASNFIYKMPVALKDVKVGDVILHFNVPMFVVDIEDDGKAISAVDPVAGERKSIMPARSPFGFDFVTKVVNFVEGAFGDAASADSPFGNMWMLMALSSDKSGVNGLKDYLPLMMLSQGGNIDPMMAMVLMGDNKDTNAILPLMFAMQNMKPAAPCNCKCGEHAN
jgi:hypothetical protein